MATDIQGGGPYLRTANIIKNFGDFRALDDVSIEIDEEFAEMETGMVPG